MGKPAPKSPSEKPRGKIGRPSKYNDTLALDICQRLAKGESLRSICRDDKMPDKGTVISWVLDGKHEDFTEQYFNARAIQAELLAEEIVEISDDATNDYMERQAQDGTKTIVADHENVQRSKLRVDSRKWVASKLLPKRYGDKLQHTGEGGGPVTFIMNIPGEDE